MVVVDQKTLRVIRVTSEQFCSNKDYLATRMHESLMSQNSAPVSRLRGLQRGVPSRQAHVKHIF